MILVISFSLESLLEANHYRHLHPIKTTLIRMAIRADTFPRQLNAIADIVLMT
jgi:hypothetical protein